MKLCVDCIHVGVCYLQGREWMDYPKPDLFEPKEENEDKGE